MTLSKVMACLLCLTVSAGTVGAQGVQPSNADRLKKRIELEKRALLRHYEEYITSLQKDIEHFKEVGKTLDPKDTAAIKENEAEIERLTKEYEAALKDRAAAQPAPGVEGRAAPAQPSPYPSPTQQGRSANVAQLPCGCPTGMKPEDEKPEGEMSEDEKRAYEKLKGEKLKEVKKNLPAGVIWCGRAGELSAQTFAEYAAPILWFSPNEPLHLDGKKLPEPLPGDKKNIGSPVVYYRVSEVMLKQIRESDPGMLELDNLKGLTLKYYFYYSEDKGFGGHLHDLESVRFDINFTVRDSAGKEITDPAQKGSGYYVANISKIIGAAHGVTWYGNQLDFGKSEKDTSLPITLFVEEGKHATSPDRNADGFYSPGYDVNYRYTDAWGVRDLLGSGQLGGAKYEGAMTKPRRLANRIMVNPSETSMKACPDSSCAKNPKACLLRPYTGEDRETLAASTEGYTLTPAQAFEDEFQRQERLKAEEAATGKRPKGDKIFGWTKEGQFGQMEDGKFIFRDGKSVPVEPKKKTRRDNFLLRAWRFGNGVERNEELWDAIPFTLRAEGRQYGFSILPPIGRYQVFFLGGYFLPKINVMFPNTRANRIPGRKTDRPVRFSLEAMYTPSASRTFDWYATAGAEWARPDPSLSYAVTPVSEGGLRFRFNASKLLVGGRIGLRVSGFPEARQPRLIFELGTGAF